MGSHRWTKLRSTDRGNRSTQTVLVSRECCQAGRATAPFSSGFGLKKRVVTCWTSSSKSVACGVKSAQLKLVTHEENTVAGGHLNVIRHLWHCELLGVERLWARRCQAACESGRAGDER